MIGRLRGTLAAKGADSVVLEVGGVGYEVAMTPRSLAGLPAVGEGVVVHTHLHVREDQLALFGFGADEERDLFRLLLGASGIGPKLALAVLATMTPAELRQAVLVEDADALTRVPGIGKRGAQKLILDLRSRLELPEGELIAGSGLAEVRAALEGLGYQSAEIREALAGLGGESEDGGVEALLRTALQRLGGR
ncbi:MAG TPA: Holliday junction branch migration protein RuvA [Gemmatimonadales bacterium]|nr:Holliday junction branch migration protein RuvA [Gemmatimonadales bacterium]